MDEITNPSYEDLADAWRKIGEALDIESDSSGWKMTWLNRVFCELLEQCGWTVTEWNAEVDVRKQRRIASDEPAPEEPER